MLEAGQTESKVETRIEIKNETKIKTEVVTNSGTVVRIENRIAIGILIQSAENEGNHSLFAVGVAGKIVTRPADVATQSCGSKEERHAKNAVARRSC
ncbi:hypothetical protein EVAR_28329_1 [Eumeta japonica]|uniref:Uncharacterized protein n=1 Tax=Eumeta variegata TaxID=151549 RepID=A0A4C1V9C0_EUMVA|nr:hypothetical protein EVAR_28329_1 [Eumeta japonica]